MLLKTSIGKYSRYLPPGFSRHSDMMIDPPLPSYQNRHRCDSVENNRTGHNVTHQLSLDVHKPDPIKWCDMKVGNLIVVRNRELIPADMILLATSESNGLGFVMTANLDGETNFKAKEVKKEFLELTHSSQIRGAKVLCELPNNNLEHFEGTYVLADGQKISLTARNILLRGCMLRNTDWILGALVYTSKETKIQMNAAEAPAKIGSMRRFVDRMTFFVFCLQVFCCMVGGIISSIYMATSKGKSMWYVWRGTESTPPKPGFSGFLQFWTYIISKSS